MGLLALYQSYIHTQTPLTHHPRRNMSMTEVKLFGKWDLEGLEIKDISLEDYIRGVKASEAVYLPYTSRKYQKKRFQKVKQPIVERLVTSLMFHGRNAGKKMLAVRVVKHCFEIIHLLTDENPIQVCLVLNLDFLVLFALE